MQEHTKRLFPFLGLGTLGLGVSMAIEFVHRRLAADMNYASFCNINSSINCDVVLTSRYATLASASISTWAIAFYLLVLGLGVALLRVERTTQRQTLGTVAVAAALWGLLFSAYMAVIAFAVLRTVCLMCSALYLISVGLFAAAWWLRSGLRVVGRRQTRERSGQDRLVIVGSVLAGVILLALGVWKIIGGSVPPSSATEIERQRPDFYRWFFAQPLAQVPSDGNHSRGNPDAPVTIVEFSDFECGHCAASHQTIDDLLRRGEQNVRVVFHHFPLDSACNPKIRSRMHPQACLAAVAAECAADQGRFWEYHNLLFDNQQHLERDYLLAYASRLGLDTSRFAACLGSEAAAARVEHDANGGAQLGIDSTPTLFINGRTIKGALETDLLTAAVTLARPSR